MFGAPQKEHQWLEQFLGDWTYEGECDAEPGKPKQKVSGVETITALGGFWIQGVSEGECPGGRQSARNIITIGFDPGQELLRRNVRLIHDAQPLVLRKRHRRRLRKSS